jgi:hypothetical protein
MARVNALLYLCEVRVIVDAAIILNMGVLRQTEFAPASESRIAAPLKCHIER